MREIDKFVDALHYRITRLIRLEMADDEILKTIERDFEKAGRMTEQTTVNRNGDSRPPVVPTQRQVQTTKDLAEALLSAAGAAANGRADVHQVNALCQCTKSLIELARLQMEATEKTCKVAWLKG